MVGTLGLAACAVAATAALAADPPLKAMFWLAPGADASAILTRTPGECLGPASPHGAAADVERALLVEVGRAAFRDPLLLGGQAARAGLSCDSCHRNGRGNPDFRFPGVSGAPGTADVTSSLFSSHRGNGVDDPKPIPDLGAPKAELKVSQAPGDGKLEAFIHGLVTEEFDGHEPPPAVLSGLAAYVRALDPARCPAAPQPMRVRGLMADADRAAAAGQALAARGDAAAAVVMLQAARARLGLVDERYAGPQLAPLRTRLRSADARLAALAQDLREARPGVPAALAAWRRDAAVLTEALASREPLSLFNPPRLSQADKRRLPAKPS